MRSGRIPPRPDTATPRPPALIGPAAGSAIVAIAVTLVVVLPITILAFRSRGSASTGASPSTTASPTPGGTPSPADPGDEEDAPTFELRSHPLDRPDLPDDWFRIVASDRSFSLIGPGRGAIHDMADPPGWEIELGTAPAACFAWVFDTDVQTPPRAERTARRLLVEWTASYTVLGEPRPIRLGATGGWIVRVRWLQENGAIVSVNRGGRQVYVLATAAPNREARHLAEVCLRSVRVPAASGAQA